MAYKPISDYGLIGDMCTTALVGLDGSIDWCCMPRCDSPSLFAAILDDENGGRFQICPLGAYESKQAYIPKTAVLATLFTTSTGEAMITDFMIPYWNSVGSEYHPELWRVVTCLEGNVNLECIFEPRFDYARGHTGLEITPIGAIAKNSRQQATLMTDVCLHQDGNSARSTFSLSQGGRAIFLLRYGGNNLSPISRFDVDAKLKMTCRFWEIVSGECQYEGGWKDAIIRSFITLHLLMYAPTGAVIAAPTTSLPEEIGGQRNWDYRYCWLRDAAFTLDILSQLGDVREARCFMEWLNRFCQDYHERTPIVSSVDFQTPLSEHKLEHLEGYRGSSPVRIGNGAAKQLQLDVFGEVMLYAHTLQRMGLNVSPDTWSILKTFVDATCSRWNKPDRGMWEVRGKRRHFVHSKFMCWTALDRGIQMAETLGCTDDIRQWQRVRDEIKADILSKGWNEKKRSFVQHYHGNALDASNLLMPLVKFLPPDDPRIEDTIRRTMQELTYDGLVYRYRVEQTSDGLPGKEGAFTMLSFWLVDCLIYAREYEQAEKLFERLLSYSNHLGLFSEMMDPFTKEALGNFPQALTHIALMHSARHLSTFNKKKKPISQLGKQFFIKAAA